MSLLPLLIALVAPTGYTPAFLPTILSGTAPQYVYVRKGNFRGYRPIHSEWTVAKTIAEARAATLADGATVLPSGTDPDRFYKILSDRIVLIHFLDGKRNRTFRTDGTPTGYVRITDQNTNISCMIEERPLLVGALPTSWYSEASTPTATPSDFAGAPASGMPSTPTAWYQAGSGEDEAHPWYYAYWAFSDPSGSSVSQYKQQLQSSGHWSVESNGADSTSLSSTTYAFITFFEMGEFPELASGWKSAKVGWGDPQS